MKKTFHILFFITCIGIVLSPVLVFAANEANLAGEFIKLQVPLPGLQEGGGVKTIGEYINAAYSFSLSALAAFCVLAFIVGGIIYITSGGDTGKTGSARSLMINSVVGLVLAMSSYLILVTINPAIVSLEITPVTNVNAVITCADNRNESPCLANPTCMWLSDAQMCVVKEPGSNCGIIKQPNSCTGGCVWLSAPFCGLEDSVEDTTQLGNREAKCGGLVNKEDCGSNTDCDWKTSGGCIAQSAALNNKCLGMPEDQCSPINCFWTGQTCMPKSEKDESCTFNNNCIATMFCDDNTQKCREKLATGSECSGVGADLTDDDAVCTSGECALPGHGLTYLCIQCNGNEGITNVTCPSGNYCNANNECFPQGEIGDYCADAGVVEFESSWGILDIGDWMCKSDNCDLTAHKCIR